MKKSSIIAIVALLVAIAGVAVAIAAYLKKHGECALCSDLDELVELDDCGDECCCCCCDDEDECAEDAPVDEPAAETDAE